MLDSRVPVAAFASTKGGCWQDHAGFRYCNLDSTLVIPVSGICCGLHRLRPQWDVGCSPSSDRVKTHGRNDFVENFSVAARIPVLNGINVRCLLKFHLDILEAREIYALGISWNRVSHGL